MIHLEIINSPDIDSIGIYKFETNQVTIGNHRTNNLSILDPDIGQKTIKILIKEEKLFIYSSSGHVPILVDQIKFQGSKSINKNNEIIIGKTILKIHHFQNDPELISDLESFVINTKEEIAKSGPGNYSIIEEIEQSLADTESLIK